MAMILLGGSVVFGGETSPPTDCRVFAVQTTHEALRKALGKAADPAPFTGWISKASVVSNLRHSKEMMALSERKYTEAYPSIQFTKDPARMGGLPAHVGVISSEELRVARRRLPAAAIVDITAARAPITAAGTRVDEDTIKVAYRYQAGRTTITSGTETSLGYNECVAFCDPRRPDGYQIFILCPK